MSDLDRNGYPLCGCLEFYGSHHPDCPVRREIARLREENARVEDIIITQYKRGVTALHNEVEKILRKREEP